jgi:hypothetical protein
VTPAWSRDPSVMPCSFGDLVKPGTILDRRPKPLVCSYSKKGERKR